MYPDCCPINLLRPPCLKTHKQTIKMTKVSNHHTCYHQPSILSPILDRWKWSAHYHHTIDQYYHTKLIMSLASALSSPAPLSVVTVNHISVTMYSIFNTIHLHVHVIDHNFVIMQPLYNYLFVIIVHSRHRHHFHRYHHHIPSYHHWQAY